MDKVLAWIISKIDEIGLKRKDVGALSQMKGEAISMYLNGKRRLTRTAAHRIMQGALGMSEKEVEYKIAELIARQNVEKMDVLELRSAFKVDHRDTSPHVILMEDSKIKFCTRSYFYRMDQHFILAFQAGEIIDSRYAIPVKEFKELANAMSKEVTDYERAMGVIGDKRF